MELHAKHNTLAQLFRERPARWGLRGDPYLWDEMAEVLGEHVYPPTEAQLATLLAHTYAQLTGASLNQSQPVFVARYSHGGMSSGHVAPRFWVEQAIPLLLTRYRDTH